ncbi:HD-GYP domain-containing protein [bacterium]|nr:HD-GYP domain-containing protein [bacterium]
MDEKLLAKGLFFLEQIIDSELEFDIYIFEIPSFKKYLGIGDKFNENLLNRIKLLGQDYIFIPESQLRNYNFSVEKKLTETLKKETIPIEKRTAILHNASVSLVEEFFNNADVMKDKERVNGLITNMVDFLTSNKNIMSKVLTLSSHDFYTYRHSVDVAIYTILFAKHVGINNPKQLNLFGQAGMFHDLGKKSVSSDIINKKGPLSDDEWVIMKKHPEEGVVLLKEIYDIPQEVIDAALYHHEKIDGSGYPNGLSGDKIPFFGRLVTIGDIFSALTTHRSYSKARTPFEALDFMVENLKNKLDKQLLMAFIKLFKG